MQVENSHIAPSYQQWRMRVIFIATIVIVILWMKEKRSKMLCQFGPSENNTLFSFFFFNLNKVSKDLSGSWSQN